MPWDAPGSTAIVVLTPEAEPVTGHWYRARTKAGLDGMRPHITLHVPFVPAERLDVAVETRLRGVLAQFQPFDYELERIERFADGLLYLAPEPARPFIELALALQDQVPEYPRYDGAHDVIIPHGTIAASADSELLARIAADVAVRLPIACRAVEATMVERGEDLRWRPRASYPLGGKVKRIPGCR
jgi:2'-5' RNA ligase